jgi:hypothetical protein
MAASKRSQFLSHLFYHVALPRNVPGREDRDLYAIDGAILDHLITATKTVIPHLPLGDQAAVDSLRVSLATCKALNVSGKIDKHTLATELKDLQGSHMLVLYATEQNAALIVYRKSK